MNSNRNTIRLTESQLRGIIKESVKGVLNELDWKTIRNYRKGRAEQLKKIPLYRSRNNGLPGFSGIEYNPEFGEVKLKMDNAYFDEVNAFNNEFAKGHGDYWVGRRRGNAGNPQYPAGRDYYAYRNLGKNGCKVMEPGGDEYDPDYFWGTDEDFWNGNKEGYEASQKIRKELEDYNNGNYEYVKGKGWVLKK